MRHRKAFKFISILVLTAFLNTLFVPYTHADDFTRWFVGGEILGGYMHVGGKPVDTKPPQEPAKNPCKAGKPVSIASGEESYTCVDLVIPGRGLNVEILHQYQSGYHTAGNFGYGWAINYYERVLKTSDGNATIVRGAGRKDVYTALSGGVYAAPPGIFEELIQNANGTWTLTLAQGEKHNFNANGTLASIVDRNGNTIAFTYDAAGLVPITAIAAYSVTGATPIVVGYDYRLTKITDTLGRVINLAYNTTGQLQNITDFAGRVVTFTYDAVFNLSKITYPVTAQFPSGVAKNFTYDANHNLASIKDPKGQTFVTNIYDASDRVTQQTLGTGTMTFDFTTAGQTTYKDRMGNVTVYGFNANGNATKIEQFTSALRAGDPASFVTNYTYNTDMLVTSVTYPKGNGVKYTYDSTNPKRRARGNVLQVRRKASMAAADSDTNDIVVKFTYEPNFNFVKTLTDAKGNVTTYTYDYELPTTDARYGTKGNLVTVTFPTVNSLTPKINYTYNANGQLTQVTDPKGNITQLTYNLTNGQIASVIQDPTGVNAVTQMTYDTFGNLDLLTNPLGKVTDYDSNALGWLIQTIDPMTFKTKYTYDANGNVTKLERQSNTAATTWQTTQFSYDIMNDLKTITDPLNRVTTNNYNKNQDLISVVDANNKTTAYTYDERRLLFKVTDANAGVTQYDYDPNGNLKKIIDAKNNATNYTFDNFDRMDTETFADTKKNVYTYDKNSNVATRTNPGAQVINYTYDALNRLTNQAYPADTTMNVTYTYDIGSLMTSAANSLSTNAFTYDKLNRVLTNTQTLSGKAYVVTYTYDKLNKKDVKYPSTKLVGYLYNANNLLQTLTVGGTALMNLTYDPLMRRAQKDLTGTAVKQAIYTYNAADELLSLENKISGGANISKHVYTYDTVSNRKTHVITAAANKSYTYTYNNIYELTGVTGSETSTYAYDKVGNRTTATGVAYVSNNLNQYTTVGGVARTYDTKGNLTGDNGNTYGYDVESRLKTFSKTGTTASYAYDAFNRRVSKTVNGTATFYVYDGDDIIEERNSAGTLVADYVHGDQTDEPLTMTRGGTTYYYFADGLGSVRQLTNSAGVVQQTYDYNSYGKLAAAPTVVNPFTFTGREYDTESGNYYYRARYYNPTLGRFLQRDPIGYADGMNLYKYVKNNSTNYLDPYGNLTTMFGEVDAGEGYGSDSLTYWAEKAAGVKNPFSGGFYNSMGFLSALWTPCTSDATVAVLSTALGGAAVVKNLAKKAAEKVVPKVANKKLLNLVEDLYKGTKNPNSVGNGSTADAIRNELLTGNPTGGKYHFQKGQEYVTALAKWLKKNPDASQRDRMVAQSILNDLKSALGGN